MELNDELLSAYQDGELDATQRERVAAALAADPGARLRLERLRQVDRALGDALPARSGDLFESALAARIRGQAVAIPRRRPVLPWAMAASVAGLLAGYLLPRPDAGGAALQAGLLEPRWQQVLDTGAAGAAGREGLQVVLSFQAGDGRYCRLFRAVASGSEGEGLACHDSASWRLVAWDGLAADSSGGFQAAGPSALIDGAMSELGGSAAFEPQEEAAAIGRGWRQP